MFVSKYYLLALFVVYLDLCHGQSCFQDNAELRAAVVEYTTDPLNNASDVALEYGSPIGEWCVGNVTNFTGIFTNLIPKLNANLSGWDVSSATSFNNMFSESIMTGIGLELWNTSSVQDFGNTFFRSSMSSDIGQWDTSSAVSNRATTCCSFLHSRGAWQADQSELFFDMLTRYSKTNPSSSSSQTDMQFMFSGTPINIDLSMWSVSKVTSMSSMFFDASNFEGLGLDSWNTTSLTDINSK
jgi:hypothetical protein